MHKNYPSHVTKEQFENIKSTLENSKKKTKPRNLDLYEVFCAVLYVLKSGCQWRMLPKNFPKWQTVYYYELLPTCTCGGNNEIEWVQ
ncbi:hypothetical protein SHM_14340 [Spiroplasma ixodetis]|uniref:Insertion element IS402-like domain-containing protein n=1 Tax=Spiroplasma ixodetis TaxID=2141 RepID=A0ABN6SY66_9MOLU|nr:hypothetical protein SHM_14340 [Spiroplasma ixodetis]